jgi:hypothetical protein
VASRPERLPGDLDHCGSLGADAAAEAVPGTVLDCPAE